MFEITITEKRTETKLVRGAHTVIEKRPFTEDELNNMARYYREQNEKIGLKDVYGYAPDREQEVTTEREILKQSVEDLDLAAVIKAINKL